MKVADDVRVRIPVLTTADPMTKARQILRDDTFREIAITDTKGRYVGYIDITDALKVTTTKSDVQIEGFVRDGAVVNPNNSLIAVAQAIREKKSDSAVVTDSDGQVLGVVLLSEIFPILCTREDLRGTVADHMHRNPTVCEADDPVSRVYAKMIEEGIAAFPVMKNRHLIGIISRRDILNSGRVRKTLESGGKVPVESVMVTPVISIGPGESLRTAAEMMVEHDLSQMPVLDEDALVGMIDRHGVLNGLSARE